MWGAGGEGVGLLSFGQCAPCSRDLVAARWQCELGFILVWFVPGGWGKEDRTAGASWMAYDQRPRKLVAHILPAQAPGEPSAAEIKQRLISRLQELKREGVGGSALANMLASLQQQPRSTRSDDVRAVSPLLQLAFYQHIAVSAPHSKPDSSAATSGSISHEAICSCRRLPRSRQRIGGGVCGAHSVLAVHLASRSALQPRR